MRSWLFVPGDSERKLHKAPASGADVLILDLEDSVSADRKVFARAIAAEAWAGLRAASPARIYVRINELRSGLADGDLAAMARLRPDGIMLPKCEGPADVQALSARLRVHEAEAGLEDGAIAVVPLVTETGRGMLAAAGFAPGLPRLAGLTWGAEDLSADVGASATRDAGGTLTGVFAFARTLTLVAAAAAEVPALDTVFVDLRDAAGLREECRRAERDGFCGKLAVHPDQVAVINAAFTPPPEAVEEARALLAAVAAAGNPGVLALGGKMVDRPHIRRAERLLARAAAAQDRQASGQGPE